MINSTAQYRRALKKELRCNNKVKKRLWDGFNQTLTAYLEEHSNPTIDDLAIAFGPPEEMAEVLMAEVTTQEHAKYRKRILCNRILISLLVVVLVLFTFQIWFYKKVGLTSTNDLNQVPVDWSETYNTVEED